MGIERGTRGRTPPSLALLARRPDGLTRRLLRERADSLGIETSIVVRVRSRKGPKPLRARPRAIDAARRCQYNEGTLQSRTGDGPQVSRSSSLPMRAGSVAEAIVKVSMLPSVKRPFAYMSIPPRTGPKSSTGVADRVRAEMSGASGSRTLPAPVVRKQDGAAVRAARLSGVRPCLSATSSILRHGDPGARAGVYYADDPKKWSSA